MTDRPDDPTRHLSSRLQTLVADVEPAPDAWARILADLPDGVAGSTGSTGSPRASARPPGRCWRWRWSLLPGAPGACPSRRRPCSPPPQPSRSDGSRSPARTTRQRPDRPPRRRVVSFPSGASPSVASPTPASGSASTGAAAAGFQAAFAACAAAGANPPADGVPGSTVLSGPATGWTLIAHAGDLTSGMAIGTAPGGRLASCIGSTYRYLGVLGGPAGSIGTVPAPAAGRVQELVGNIPYGAGVLGVNRRAGVLAQDVARMTVTAAAGVTVDLDVNDGLYALVVGAAPGTTTQADATIHLFDAAGTEIWSGPVE